MATHDPQPMPEPQRYDILAEAERIANDRQRRYVRCSACGRSFTQSSQTVEPCPGCRRPVCIECAVLDEHECPEAERWWEHGE